MENRNIPVTPLPNPGEGGAVFPGAEDPGAIPIIPLPNPGEGGAVNPGNGTAGGGIVIQPLPVIPALSSTSSTVIFLLLPEQRSRRLIASRMPP